MKGQKVYTTTVIVKKEDSEHLERAIRLSETISLKEKTAQKDIFGSDSIKYQIYTNSLVSLFNLGVIFSINKNS